MIRTIRTRAGKLLRATAGVALALGVTAVAVPSFAQPAHAAASVTVTGEADPNGESTLQLQGSGFQSVQGGFGGIYVLFGWVDDPSGGSWKPSNGGVTGTNYRYVYDDETNPAGFQLFVTFPGSSTASAANGGELHADGTWSATLRVPGAVFNTFDRQLNERQVDCTQVTCGIITIGAHGVKNANNESFTPVTWAGAAPAADAQHSSSGSQTPAESSQSTADAQNGSAAQSGSAAQAQRPAEVSPVQELTAPGGDAAAMPGWFVAILPALILVGVSLIILAAGVGGYLAVKALLLGVNPEALEKVRGQRERAALKQRDKQKQKTMRFEHKMELRGAKEADRAAALIARTEMKHAAVSADAPKPADPRASGESFDRWLSFFERSQKASKEDDSATRSATESADEDAPTLVMSVQRSRGEGGE